jgi:hypothetical protein
MPNKPLGQEKKQKSKPLPFRTERVGHAEKLAPESRSQLQGDDVVPLYYPKVFSRQE